MNGRIDDLTFMLKELPTILTIYKKSHYVPQQIYEGFARVSSTLSRFEGVYLGK